MFLNMLLIRQRTVPSCGHNSQLAQKLQSESGTVVVFDRKNDHMSNMSPKSIDLWLITDLL